MRLGSYCGTVGVIRTGAGSAGSPALGALAGGGGGGGDGGGGGGLPPPSSRQRSSTGLTITQTSARRAAAAEAPVDTRASPIATAVAAREAKRVGLLEVINVGTEMNCGGGIPCAGSPERGMPEAA